MAIENDRLRKIEHMINAIAEAALKQHESPARVSANLSDAIRAPLMSLLEEVDQMESRIKELEDLAAIEGPD
jgi:hypothetical protein